MPTWESPEKGKKRIESDGHPAVGIDQKGRVGWSWLMAGSQSLFGIHALVWNHPDFASSTQLLQALLSRDAHPASAVVHQKAVFGCFGSSVCHTLALRREQQLPANYATGMIRPCHIDAHCS